MKMIATLMFVSAVASSALGIICPVPPTVPGADISKIAGRWYEIAGPSSEDVSVNVTCNTQDFTPRKDENFNFTFHTTLSDGREYNELWLAERTGDQKSLQLYPIHEKTQYPYTIYIAETDYDNYMAAYTCIVIPPRSRILFSWILSRTNSMDADKYAELSDLLVNKVGVPSDSFGPIIQKDCKYQPVPQ